MSKTLDALVALGLTAGIVVASEPVVGFYEWATATLDNIGRNERVRHQQIQNLVCEAESISSCPTVPAWIPVDEQVRNMTVSTTTTTILLGEELPE